MHSITLLRIAMVLKSQSVLNPNSPSVRGVAVVRVMMWLLRISRLE